MEGERNENTQEQVEDTDRLEKREEKGIKKKNWVADINTEWLADK